jgi:hypothetical protein
MLRGGVWREGPHRALRRQGQGGGRQKRKPFPFRTESHIFSEPRAALTPLGWTPKNNHRQAVRAEVSLICYGFLSLHLQSSPGIAAAVSWSTPGGPPPAVPRRLARAQAGCQAVSCGLLRRRVVARRSAQAERAEHTATPTRECLRAALRLTALAAAVRPAVRRAARLSRLGAAEVLAAPAPAVRNALLRPARRHTREAAFLGAPPAAAMPAAEARVAFSTKEAAVVLTAPAPAVHDAQLRARPRLLAAAVLLA